VEHERSRKAQKGIDRNVHLIGYQPVESSSVSWKRAKRRSREVGLCPFTCWRQQHFSPPTRRRNSPDPAMTSLMVSALLPYRVQPRNQDEGLGFLPAP
jgi:hypothetical protein